ncbi:MAG: helix-turn-helix domain-containing protein [Chlorobium sp.]
MRFKTAGDAASFLCGDEKVKNLVEEELEISQIVNRLIQVRLEKEVSQKELARRMGCDPSKISRMESGNDFQLKIGDITQYVSALDVQMDVIFDDRSLPVADRIKRDVFSPDPPALHRFEQV